MMKRLEQYQKQIEFLIGILDKRQLEEFEEWLQKEGL